MGFTSTRCVQYFITTYVKHIYPYTTHILSSSETHARISHPHFRRKCLVVCISNIPNSSKAPDKKYSRLRRLYFTFTLPNSVWISNYEVLINNVSVHSDTRSNCHFQKTCSIVDIRVRSKGFVDRIMFNDTWMNSMWKVNEVKNIFWNCLYFIYI